MSERGSSVIPSGISKAVSIMTHNYSLREETIWSQGQTSHLHLTSSSNQVMGRPFFYFGSGVGEK